MGLANSTQNFEEIVEQIIKAVQSLRFGSVEITVHEGRVTQIETREKLRIGPNTQKTEQKA